MSRYFLELSYKGTKYSGFQSQRNANTIQAEVEKAFEILQKTKVVMVGSSRTDAGVHALQNYFHFDTILPLHLWRGIEGEAHFVYKMNAILPDDIAIKKIDQVADDAHCRFDAISREYKYFIYRYKNPFLKETAFYFPYKIDINKLNKAAEIVKSYSDFASFSKRKTQVKTFKCAIIKSEWKWENECLVYHVKANRFLRGMIRGLVATMLLVGREKISLDEFENIIKEKDSAKANFSAPSHGLILIKVEYLPDIIKKE